MTASESIVTPSVGKVRTDVLGHPRGLIYLTAAEGFERFSYFGMQSLLVLYLTHYLLLPERIGTVVGFGALRTTIESVTGPLSGPALASQIFGLYAGLVYLTPVIGGLVADRWVDRSLTVTFGALTMVAGHFLMAFDRAFVLAIVLLLVGVGCFKGNIASQVGQLYAADDRRRATAFQIFQLSISTSVMLAPLIAGTLGEKVGWHYGFAAAGVGMVMGLAVYRAGRPWYADPPHPVAATRTHEPWRRVDRQAVLLLVLLLPILAGAQVGNQQMFNAFVVWGQANFDLQLAGFDMPVTWVLSLDSLVSSTCLVLAIAFWRAYAKRRREPNDLTKMAGAAIVMALAPLALVLASLQQQTGGGKVSLLWAFAFELINEMGFVVLVPVALSFFTRVAPRQIQGVALGLYYVAFFFSNLVVGRLGGFLERMSGVAFWLLHAAIVGTAALLLVVLAVWSKRGRGELSRLITG